MIGKYLHKQGCDKLLVIALGWSADHNMVKHLSFEGYDIYVTYDYNNISTDGLFGDVDFDAYKEVSLLAWSFGVWAAGIVAEKIPTVHKAIAVNGTPYAVDDNWGVSRRSFRVTVWAIGEYGLDKFNERMLGDYGDEFSPALRDFDNQMEELHAMNDYFKQGLSYDSVAWDVAIVGVNDKIIPAENIIRYWEHAGVRVVELEMEHYPFTTMGCDAIKKELGING